MKEKNTAGRTTKKTDTNHPKWHWNETYHIRISKKSNDEVEIIVSEKSRS